MSYLDLYTSSSIIYGGLQRSFEEAEFVLVGVPFDVTSSFRPGSRFAPLAIREASLNIESYSFRAGVDLADVRIHDAGDLHVAGDVNETLKRLELVVRDIINGGKTPVLIGGEHTLSLGAVKGIQKDLAVLCFDAHMDLRSEYMDQPICHATVMRRISEIVDPRNIVEIGTRAACKEELEHAENHGITYFAAHQMLGTQTEEIVNQVNSFLERFNQLYVTIDMDVLDPAFAPAVQNPEPEGLSLTTLLEILHKTCGKKVVGFDVVEVAPHYDGGNTAIQAAKLISELLCYIHGDKHEKERS